MKSNKWIVVIFLALILSACGGTKPVAPAATDAPAATKTSVPAAATATLVATKTPVPTNTATEIPPTPASKGEPVTNGKIEVTVIDIFRHDRLVPGGAYYYTPNPGYMAINLFIKIKNVTEGENSINWSDVHIISDDASLAPDFAGMKATGAKDKVAPLSIGYNEIATNASFVLKNVAYLQAVYIIKDKPEQTILFGIADTPLIQIVVKK